MKHKRPDKTEQETLENPAGEVEQTANAETIAALEAKTETLNQQLEDAQSRFKYLLADFENYKRNVAKERLELQQTAGRDIVTALLPVLDDFDRAAKNGALQEGMNLVHQKLLQTLFSRGLAALDAKAGDAFNPDFQEAIAEIPAPSDDMKGKIVDIIEQGYQLGDRIIRYAKVVVGQ